MDSLHILYIYKFLSISDDAFILCRVSLNRFRKVLFEAETIDSIFYVSHHDHIYILYIYI